MGNVSELTSGEFNDFVKKGLVFIDFFADWCMPCVMMGPVIESLSDRFEGKIKFGKINIEDNRMLAQKFNIMSIPNFKLFKDGKIVDEFVGAVPEDEIEERLEEYL